MSDELQNDARAVVRTVPVRVRVFTRNGATIEGDAHIKPGAYQRRVSDILNLGKVRYVAITSASYAMPEDPEPRRSECLLVNIDDIVMMDVTAGDDG